MRRAAGAMVRAPLTMLVRAPEAPLSYSPEAAGSAAEEVWPGDYADIPVDIKDAREALGGGDGDASAGGAPLDTQGFTLVAHPTKVADFASDEEVKRVYYAENEALLLATIPEATKVVLFDHTRRSDSRAVQTGKTMRQPAGKVHGDYTSRSGIVRLSEALPEDVQKEVEGRRFQIVNVWRSINGVVERSPLAFCDAQSVPEASYVPMQRVTSTRTGEVLVAVHAPEMQWYWYPRMAPDEAAVFKTFDSSDAQGTSRWCLHSSFQIPDTPADAPARESIETRAFVFF